MNQNNVIEFKKPGSAPRDLLTDLLRRGAKKLIHEAVEAELESFLAQFSEERLADGRQAVVRNGYLPEREVQTSRRPSPLSLVRMPRACLLQQSAGSRLSGQMNIRLGPSEASLRSAMSTGGQTEFTSTFVVTMPAVAFSLSSGSLRPGTRSSLL